ncbi:hypothetical protein, partial [Pseudomonas sp. AH2 (2023)]|uniref:hypothetical protein n=1 Tax=Pseudomonas sp. AH2 (2023) TaxID=3048599 RepID=UPI002B23C100
QASCALLLQCQQLLWVTAKSRGSNKFPVLVYGINVAGPTCPPFQENRKKTGLGIKTQTKKTM